MALTWFGWLLPAILTRRYILAGLSLPKCYVKLSDTSDCKPYYIYDMGKGTYMIVSHESVLEDKIRKTKRRLENLEEDLDKIKNPELYKADNFYN
jgi:hypothetical protein